MPSYAIIFQVNEKFNSLEEKTWRSGDKAGPTGHTGYRIAVVC